jgi:predicted TIM-barrel fold metal-dependent hydrolase
VQLLDPFRIEYAILAHDFVIGYAAVQNPDFADALVRAVNDWAVDTWLSIPDPRLLGVIFVPMQLPEAGAAEIRRLAGHPLMVEARLPFNTLGKPFGHPLYHPIYEAASEAHLPISFHVNGGENVMGLGHNNGAGISNSFFEFATLNPQPALNHLASFITHGVFEKFPDLRLLLVETGTAWIPSFLWALDSQYKNLQRESSWVKKLPSEYFREHVRVTTQPLEVTEKSVGRFVDLMEAFGGMEDILCFSSDYPHWDFDDPRHIASWLPASWHRKVFFDNAAGIYAGRLAMKAGKSAAVGLKPEPVGG